MKIDRIVLSDVTDDRGNSYNTWIDTSKEEITVCFDGKGRPRCDYYLHTLIEYVLRENESEFIVTDGFDGTDDVSIKRSEIETVVRDALTVLPGRIGSISVKTVFEPCDPRVPF